MNSNYLSLKEYAIKNKISLFSAMKLAKNSKVDTIVKIINGKEQIFIKEDSKIDNKEIREKEISLKDLFNEIEKLKKRIKILEEKVNKN